MPDGMNGELSVSGPVNVVRLEGNVFGINKVLYTFFDYHLPCNSETRCKDIFSDTIARYLTEQFKGASGSTLDFFLETFPTTITYKGTSRDIYLEELRNMVAEAFSYNPEENRVYPSDIFPNVRLHYIDIRDYLFSDILWAQFDYVLGVFMNIYNYVMQQQLPKQDDLADLKNELLELIKSIKGIRGSFFGQTGGKGKIIREGTKQVPHKEHQENAQHLIGKIEGRYKHNQVKTVMLRMLDDYLLDGLDSAIDGLDTVVKTLNGIMDLSSVNPHMLNPTVFDVKEINTPDFSWLVNYGPNMDEIMAETVSIYQMMVRLNTVCKSALTIPVDVFFLRRFLDKDYITNGISYTGAAHSLMYVHILTKYFDFKVTNASYSKYSIAETNKRAVNTAYGIDFFLLFVPPTTYQCSDISGFPPGFK
jgi:hypothetical protein